MCQVVCCHFHTSRLQSMHNSSHVNPSAVHLQSPSRQTAAAEVSSSVMRPPQSILITAAVVSSSVTRPPQSIYNLSHVEELPRWHIISDKTTAVHLQSISCQNCRGSIIIISDGPPQSILIDNTTATHLPSISCQRLAAVVSPSVMRPLQ